MYVQNVVNKTTYMVSNLNVKKEAQNKTYFEVDILFRTSRFDQTS